MVLSRQNKLFDSLRNKWVHATPEEIVRQKWIHYMIHELHYPKHSLIVEKALSELVDTASFTTIPKRRFDLVCMQKVGGTIQPILLMEFKSIPLKENAIEQILGYNFFFHAKYICIANNDEVITGVYDKKENQYSLIDYLPTFDEIEYGN